MKTLLTLLAAITLATTAQGGLTGTQIKKVIAFADSSGSSFIGNQDIPELEKGRAITARVMVFYRVTDGDYACVDASVLSVEDAIYEFIGSKTMFEMTRLPNKSAQPTQTPY